jgi:hypothetical protein
LFRLKKLHPPFGSKIVPQYESTYSEGLIKVVDGVCEVAKEASRDYLLKIGYEEIRDDLVLAGVGVIDSTIDEPRPLAAPPPRPKPKKKNRR